MSIRVRLILVFLLIALVPLGLLGVVGLETGERALEHAIGDATRDVAMEKAATIDAILKARIREARTLARHPAVRKAVRAANAGWEGQNMRAVRRAIAGEDAAWVGSDGRTETARQLLDAPLSRFLSDYQRTNEGDYGEIFVTDRHGALVGTTRTLSDYDQSDEGWWQNGFNAGPDGFFVDDRGYDETVHAIVAGVVVPVRDGGETVGVLKINFRVNAVLAVVSSGVEPKGEDVLLARSQGTVLASARRQRSGTESHQARLAPREGGGWARGRRGERRVVVGYAPITTPIHARRIGAAARKGVAGEQWQATTWYIHVERDQDRAFAAIADLRRHLVWASVVLGLLAAAAAWRLARGISRPIRVLQDGTARVAAGDLDHRVEVAGRDEIAALGRDFDAMTRRLRETMASRDELNREVEERRAAEAALRESETLNRALLDASTDAAFLIDAEGTLLAVNEATQQRLAGPGEELVGRCIYDSFPEALAAERRRQARTVMRTGRAMRTVDERQGRVLDNNIYPVPGPDGVATRLAVYSRDITDLKQAERDLERLMEDLKRSNAELQQFAYAASHDLQEPLRAVTNYLQLLERRYADRLDDDAREFIGFAVDGARRMRRLIDDLLSYSRIETQGAPPERVEPETALAEALENLSAAVEEAGAAIDVATPLPPVMADRSQMTRLFQNLIGNAIKYRAADRAPEVGIAATTEEGVCHITIRDNGIGIPEERLEQIFLVFERLHGRSAYDGTGIGLAVCKRIVERCGGRIWVDSVEGEGSTFHVVLPAAGAEGSTAS